MKRTAGNAGMRLVAGVIALAVAHGLCVGVGSAAAGGRDDAGAALADGQTSITVRDSHVISDAAGPLTLGQIADIRGANRERLAGVVVLERSALRSGDGVTITLEDVRRAIDEWDASGREGGAARVNWGRVMLAGSACSVRMMETQVRQDERKPRPALRDERPVGIDVAGADTLRRRIGLRLAAMYEVDPSDVRVRLMAAAPDQSAALDQACRPDVRVEVQPEGGASAGRVPLRVDVYRDDRLLSTHRYTADIEIRRAVAVLNMAVERDAGIDASMVSTQERWVSPMSAEALRPEEMRGLIARRRLDAGSMITRGDVQTPIVVRRGDFVTVHTVSGPFVIKARARALSSARDGEVVTLQVEGSKKTFNARMSGRGVAVMIVNDATPSAGTDARDGGGDAGAAEEAARPDRTVRVGGVTATGTTVRERSRQGPTSRINP
ncbi:MAG: flagellar basal body P-ring formation chaperone FlgA [Phycisphaerales bacterium]|jgi:flagella basal body P-ring formation protein FlgA|nr:flagellar basal body P-ring formation chaperone FlgA [Phycisphaeraceae bacterium]